MIHELKQLTTKEVMTMIEGSVKAIVDDPDYFYNSGVGPQYRSQSDSDSSRRRHRT